MNTLEINKRNFDNAKNQLKEFSEKIPDAITLPPVPTSSGLFDWFEHNVTGAELNDQTEKIQKNFVSQNNNIIKLFKEFGQVYVALESLDKDYIQAIILNIKATEEVSNQAKKSAEDAKKNTIDIAMTIEVQKSMMEALIQFKDKIENNNHLENIEEIWKEIHKTKEELVKINTKKDETIESLTRKIKTSLILSGISISAALIGIVLNTQRIL